MLSQDKAVSIDNLSKLYRIGYKDEISNGFANTVVNFIKRPNSANLLIILLAERSELTLRSKRGFEM